MKKVTGITADVVKPVPKFIISDEEYLKVSVLYVCPIGLHFYFFRGLQHPFIGCTTQYIIEDNHFSRTHGLLSTLTLTNMIISSRKNSLILRVNQFLKKISTNLPPHS